MTFTTFSRFCRDPEAWKTLLEQVLRPLANEKGISAKEGTCQTIRCWSCGCSSGEEAYYLRMLWRHHLEKEFPGVRLTVLATDINEDCISLARNAVYSFHSVEGLDATYLAKDFDCVPPVCSPERSASRGSSRCSSPARLTHEFQRVPAVSFLDRSVSRGSSRCSSPARLTKDIHGLMACPAERSASLGSSRSSSPARDTSCLYQLREHARLGVEFKVQDVRKAMPAEVFDLILSRYSVCLYLHLATLTDVLSAMLLPRLRPGGYFMIGSKDNLPLRILEACQLKQIAGTAPPHSTCTRIFRRELSAVLQTMQERIAPNSSQPFLALPPTFLDARNERLASRTVLPSLPVFSAIPARDQILASQVNSKSAPPRLMPLGGAPLTITPPSTIEVPSKVSVASLTETVAPSPLDETLLQGSTDLPQIPGALVTDLNPQEAASSPRRDKPVTGSELSQIANHESQRRPATATSHALIAPSETVPAQLQDEAGLQESDKGLLRDLDRGVMQSSTQSFSAQAMDAKEASRRDRSIVRPATAPTNNAQVPRPLSAIVPATKNVILNGGLKPKTSDSIAAPSRGDARLRGSANVPNAHVSRGRDACGQKAQRSPSPRRAKTAARTASSPTQIIGVKRAQHTVTSPTVIALSGALSAQLDGTAAPPGFDNKLLRDSTAECSQAPSLVDIASSAKVVEGATPPRHERSVVRPASPLNSNTDWPQFLLVTVMPNRGSAAKLSESSTVAWREGTRSRRSTRLPKAQGSCCHVLGGQKVERPSLPRSKPKDPKFASRFHHLGY